MRIPVLLFACLIILSLAVDVYIYIVAKKRCRSAVPSRIQLYGGIILLCFVITMVCIPRRSGSDSQLLFIMWCLFGFLSVYLSKFLFCIIDIIACSPKLFHKKRLSWLSVTGGVLAILTFLLIWWGALVGRYRIQVNEVEISVANLPDSFDGYKIVQFSDIHVGTFGSDTAFVKQFVDRINAENGDLIVFTGDIVNRKTDELLPFVSVFSELEAPDGVLSILGNHDYGDYSDWPDSVSKAENMSMLYDLNKKMGWNLLSNSHEYIYNGTDSIAIIGVENVGDPPFKIYGSLKNSYPDLQDSVVKILLTHNPAHWSQEVEGSDKNIALTLSGHTHAMQMELFGVSPAVFRYKTWGGLYNDENNRHQLYVNIGAGTVGLPMRLGATPEITVFTLRKAK